MIFQDKETLEKYVLIYTSDKIVYLQSSDKKIYTFTLDYFNKYFKKVK